MIFYNQIQVRMFESCKNLKKKNKEELKIKQEQKKNELEEKQKKQIVPKVQQPISQEQKEQKRENNLNEKNIMGINKQIIINHHEQTNDQNSQFQAIISKKHSFTINLKENQTFVNIFPAHDETFLLQLDFISDDEKPQCLSVFKHIQDDGSLVKQFRTQRSQIKMIDDDKILIIQPVSIISGRIHRYFNHKHLILEQQGTQIRYWYLYEDQIQKQPKIISKKQKLTVEVFNQTKIICFLSNNKQNQSYTFQFYKHPILLESQPINCYSFRYNSTQRQQIIASFRYKETCMKCGQSDFLNLNKQRYHRRHMHRHIINHKKQCEHFILREPNKIITIESDHLDQQTYFRGKINNKSSMLFFDYEDYNQIINKNLKQQEQQLKLPSAQKKFKFYICDVQGCKIFIPTCFSGKDQIYSYLAPKAVTQVNQFQLLLEYDVHTLCVDKSYIKNGYLKTLQYIKNIPWRLILWNYSSNTYRHVAPSLKKQKNIQFYNIPRKFEPQFPSQGNNNFYPMAILDPETLNIVGEKQEQSIFCNKMQFCEYDPSIYIDKNIQISMSMSVMSMSMAMGMSKYRDEARVKIAINQMRKPIYTAKIVAAFMIQEMMPGCDESILEKVGALLIRRL